MAAGAEEAPSMVTQWRDPQQDDCRILQRHQYEDTEIIYIKISQVTYY